MESIKMEIVQDAPTSNGTNGTHDADSLVMKGLELFKQQKFLDALPLYEQAIEANPKHYLAWYNKGTVLDMLGRSSEAVRCFEKTTQMNEADARGWNYLAVVLAKLRRLEEATIAIEKALALQPKSPIYWWTKTRIYEVQGRWSDAAFCLERVLEHDPNDKNAALLLPELRQYRDHPTWDTASRELDAFLSSFKVKVADMTQGHASEVMLLRQERDSLQKKIETLESKATIGENNLSTLVLSLKRMEEKNRKVEAENHLLTGSETALTSLTVQELKNIEAKVQGALDRIQQAINEKEKRKDMCSSCQKNVKCMVFVSCGHSCVCEKCAEDLNACPICNREGKAIKIVFS